MTLGCVKYLTWYHISDVYTNRMRECETMASLVCGASNLKCDDYRLKHRSFLSKSCTMCNLAAYEDVNHLVMSCPATSALRTNLFDEIILTDENNGIWQRIDPEKRLETLLGGNPLDIPLRAMFQHGAYPCSGSIKCT